MSICGVIKREIGLQMINLSAYYIYALVLVDVYMTVLKSVLVDDD